MREIQTDERDIGGGGGTDMRVQTYMMHIHSVSMAPKYTRVIHLTSDLRYFEKSVTKI